MATGRGTRAVMLGIVESSYGSPVTITDGLENSNLITFESETLSKAIGRAARDWLDGSASPGPDRQGVWGVGGSITSRMVYDEEEGTNQGIGVGLLLALATQCGVTSSSHGDDTYAVTGYNRYTPANDKARSITLAIDKQVSQWTLCGCKCSSFRMYGDKASGTVKADLGIRAQDLRGYPAFGSRDAGPEHAFASLIADFPTDPTPVAFTDLTLRLGDRDNALTSSDNTRVTSFDFTDPVGLSDDEYATPSSAGEDQQAPLEHEGDAKAVQTLQVVLPRYDSDTIIGWYEDDTELQAELEFSYSASKKIWLRLPNMRVTNFDAPVSGPGLIPQTVDLACYKFSGADTVHAATHKFEDGSTELKDENSMRVAYGIETLDDRAASPFGI